MPVFVSVESSPDCIHPQVDIKSIEKLFVNTREIQGCLKPIAPNILMPCSDAHLRRVSFLLASISKLRTDTFVSVLLKKIQTMIRNRYRVDSIFATVRFHGLKTSSFSTIDIKGHKPKHV